MMYWYDDYWYSHSHDYGCVYFLFIIITAAITFITSSSRGDLARGTPENTYAPISQLRHAGLSPRKGNQQ